MKKNENTFTEHKESSLFIPSGIKKLRGFVSNFLKSESKAN